MAKIETRTVLSEGTEPSLENSTFYIKDYKLHSFVYGSNHY